jgi:serine protease AprX
MPTQPFFRLSRRIVLLAAALVVGGSSSVWSQSIDSARLDPLLQVRSRQLTGRSRVIVEFRGDPDARVITRHRGVAGRQLPDGRAQVADLDNTALALLSKESDVAWVGADHDAFATLERSGAAIAATVARQQFDVTGKGVGVVVIDSGITAWHDDLYLTRSQSPRADSRIVHFRDFTQQTSPRVWTSDHPSDDYGHGTHVAGIIAGNGFDSDGARSGVAPGVNLIGLKVLDADGHGYISDVIAAIDYAIALKDAYNIRVMNLSVASGVFESYNTDPLARAAKRAVDAGIVVIASAGNLGENAVGESQWGGITCPGNAPWVLTVGAASHQGTKRRSDDIRARFSSIGPTWIDHAAKPDILAHGVGIESLSDPHSTLYATYPEYLLDGTTQTSYRPYLSLTGTSMAAPFVAGTVALMLEANPDLTPNAVKAILEYTAEEREGESVLAQGAGLLNALGAVRMATFFETPQHGVPEPVDTIEQEPIAWSEHITWGNNRVAGGILLPGSNAWALGVTWGAEATSEGRPIVWGVRAADSIVWSTSRKNGTVWKSSRDDSIVWSTERDDSIVWSTWRKNSIVWSTSLVWSTADKDSIVWSTADKDSIVWSTADKDSIVWSTADKDSIVWSTADKDSIVWSTAATDSIVWSTAAADSIVWSTGTVDQVLWPAPAIDNRRRDVPGRH